MQNLTSFTQNSSGNIVLKSGKTITFTKGNLAVGAFASASAGSGVTLSSANTAAVRFYADDGGVALSGDDLRNVVARTLITKAIVDTDLTVSGLVGQIKHAAVDSKANTSYMAGVRGYFEIVAGGTIYNAAGVRAGVELPATAVIASGGVLSGLLIDAVSLGGTHTGKAGAIHVVTPGAGTWDSLLIIGASTGCTTAGTSKSTLGTVGVWLNVSVGGTAYFVPCYASTTT